MTPIEQKAAEAVAIYYNSDLDEATKYVALAGVMAELQAAIRGEAAAPEFKTVMDHKYIDQRCHESGCQYLVLEAAAPTATQGQDERIAFEEWLGTDTCEVHIDESANKNAWYGWLARSRLTASPSSHAPARTDVIAAHSRPFTVHTQVSRCPTCGSTCPEMVGVMDWSTNRRSCDNDYHKTPSSHAPQGEPQKEK